MNGDYHGAISEYQESLRISPESAASHYCIGVAFYNTNNYLASIRELKRALALNPSLSDAQTKIQLAYKKVGSGAMPSYRLN